MRRDLLDLMQLRTTAKWGFFMSLDMAAALWYRETALRTKPGSRNTYITAYMYMASDHIGSVRIRKITPGLIEDLYHRLRSRGSTSSALAGLHAALCSIFSHATSRGVISHNPMTQVNTQTLKKPGIRELPEKTPPQFMEYVKNKNPQTYLILFLLLNTGLRVGDYHVIIGLNQLDTAKYKGFRKIWSYDFLQRNSQNTAERSKNLIRYLS